MAPHRIIAPVHRFVISQLFSGIAAFVTTVNCWEFAVVLISLTADSKSFLPNPTLLLTNSNPGDSETQSIGAHCCFLHLLTPNHRNTQQNHRNTHRKHRNAQQSHDTFLFGTWKHINSAESRLALKHYQIDINVQSIKCKWSVDEMVRERELVWIHPECPPHTEYSENAPPPHTHRLVGEW